MYPVSGSIPQLKLQARGVSSPAQCVLTAARSRG
eukprot:CAMPEP_0171134920 /NCGR_PEP_ID=MMETSP0766_2-20121228/128877_1 /TAXON_ID=439317 /ORGANISM="Gambierdiscus australes, Strain CAWD 149" /LENGTH=33 /DNA_ID= /DNA_START= /DNA_END= /DNA_ORIENTATION=